jgi:hypothetical protein
MRLEKRKYLPLLPLLTVMLLCACLISGTFVIVWEVDDQDVHASQHFYKFTVNLTEDQDWKDHKDKINDISDAALTFKLINQGSSAATGQVFVSLDSTLNDTTAVKSHATVILDGITVPAHDSLYMDMAHYYDLLQNFDTLKGVVKTGVFTAYAIVPNTLDVKLRDAIVVVTVNVGL